MKFGERVLIHTGDVLIRTTIRHKGHAVTIRPSDRWRTHASNLIGWARPRQAYGWDVKSTIREGIYIGYRTVSDGYSEFLGMEEGNQYHLLASYRVAVVVLSERENPVYMFPSDVGAGELE